MRIFALDRSFYKPYRLDIAQLGPEASQRLRIAEGFAVSEATVGRILRHLMDRGVILPVRTRRQK